MVNVAELTTFVIKHAATDDDVGVADGYHMQVHPRLWTVEAFTKATAATHREAFELAVELVEALTTMAGVDPSTPVRITARQAPADGGSWRGAFFVGYRLP